VHHSTTLFSITGAQEKLDGTEMGISPNRTLQAPVPSVNPAPGRVWKEGLEEQDVSRLFAFWAA